ncbi:MAG TPA: Gfo/Idh/MocA family oxidoreductase [Caulobacteraceae bacterium]|nr:Gfo/Idh/MocA family oxidoreductase [Caulobacteraceae bacterium]
MKAGVAGAGVFGGYHAQQYAAMEGVALAAVFDPDGARAAALAQRLGAQAVTRFEDLLALSDVVSVASPAVTHAELGLAALRAGKPTYVEKPIATSLEDADRLLAAAAETGVVLAVGHVERVVFQAMGLLDVPEPPRFMESVRKGPWSPRGSDVSCVLDLMIHDIDLGLALNPAEPLAAEAQAQVEHGPFADAVRAEVTLADGSSMILEASRIAETRERRMRLVYAPGELEIDFLTGAFRNTTAFELNPKFAETPAGRDRLAASLGAFLAAVRGEAARPAVTGAEAVAALDLALAIEQAAEC